MKKNGDTFEGTFRDGAFEGQFIIHLHDGSRQKVNYHRGKLHGKALEEKKDGSRFEGSYKNGERDGNFVERDRNGKITAKGHYENGQRFVDK